MSKRDGSDSIQMLREQGKSPDEVVGLLAASVGLAEAGESVSAGRLLDRLSLEEFTRILRQEAQRQDDDSQADQGQNEP